MGRKNIFEMLADSNSIEKDTYRINTLFDEYDFAYKGRITYTLNDIVDSYCFSGWSCKGRCLDVDDFLDLFDVYGTHWFQANDLDSFLTTIEIVYNFWFLARKFLNDNEEGIKASDTVVILKDFMDECLSEYNFKAFYFEDKEQCIIAEDSPQVTAASEVTEAQTSIQIIRYNHYAMKGDISEKRAILLLLADYLEGRRTEICRINNALYNTITGALNNLNIRHNNIDPGNRHTYKRLVAGQVII